MKHICHAILLLAAAALAYSCDSERSARLLAKADSLQIHKPYEARAMLVADSEAICSGGKAARMGYALARTEADDKCFAIHTSDSAMLEAAEYYNRRDDALAATRAWYLLGRVYCDMRFYSSALPAFENAAKTKATGNPRIAHYQSLAYTWTASIYEEKELYGKALHYNIKAYELAKKSGDASTAVYSLRDIGRDYSLAGKNNLAIPYYKKAASMAKKLKEPYIYNMIQDELALVLLDEGKTGEALNALCSPNRKTLDGNKPLHYFSWATYYQKKNSLDSAVFYFKKNMEYGSTSTKSETSLAIAQLYKEHGLYDKASDYYELHLKYENALKEEQASEYKDYINNIERNIESERQNHDLLKTRAELIILIFLIAIVALCLALIFVKSYNKKKRFYELQQERIKMYWKKRHEEDYAKNEERIQFLEKELTSSQEKLTGLREELIRNEMTVLQMKNKQLDFEKKHHELLVSDLTDTDVYKFFHNPTSKPTSNDFHKLAEALNIAYNDFTSRLKEFYPDISVNEIRICCLIKANLTPKEICGVTDTYFSYVNMVKTRLYKKMFNKKGSAKELDKFIEDF